MFEPRSATSCLQVFQDDFAEAFEGADEVVVAPLFRTKLAEDRAAVAGRARRGARGEGRARARHLDVDAESCDRSSREAASGDLIVVMSNGGFDGIHEKLLDALGERGK